MKTNRCSGELRNLRHTLAYVLSISILVCVMISVFGNKHQLSPTSQPVQLDKALMPAGSGQILYTHAGEYFIPILNKSDPTQDLRNFLRWNEHRLYKQNPRRGKVGLRISGKTVMNVDSVTILYWVRVEEVAWEDRTTFPQYEENPVRPPVAGSHY
jgi:hypothetical protein